MVCEAASRAEEAERVKKRSQADVWIDLGLTLGGIVALFSGMAGALILLLSSGPHP